MMLGANPSLCGDGVFPRKSPPLCGYRQQLREAKVVPIRVGDVKEALAPGRISRGLRLQYLCPQRPVAST